MKFKIINKSGGDVIAVQCRSCSSWHELEEEEARPDLFNTTWTLRAGRAIVCKCGDVFKLTSGFFIDPPRHHCNMLPSGTVVFKEFGGWWVEAVEGNRFRGNIFACPYCGERLGENDEKT